jgi:hypothetical protein
VGIWADEERLVQDLIEKTGKYVLRCETLKEEQLKIIQKHGAKIRPPQTFGTISLYVEGDGEEADGGS